MNIDEISNSIINDPNLLNNSPDFSYDSNQPIIYNDSNQPIIYNDSNQPSISNESNQPSISNDSNNISEKPTMTTDILNEIAGSKNNIKERNNNKLRKEFDNLTKEEKKHLIVRNEIMEILPLSLIIVLIIFILLLIYILKF